MDSQMIIVMPPLIALLAGLLILFVPRVLNYVVAAYLILIGIIGLYPHVFAQGAMMSQ